MGIWVNKLLAEVSHWAGFCRYIVLWVVENATELYSSVEIRMEI